MKKEILFTDLYKDLSAKYIKEDAPREAKAIIQNPDRPSGTLPHSMEAVLGELAYWGQYGHARVMDPEIAKLAVQLAELIKAKSQHKK